MITVNANLKNAITGTGTQLVRLTGHCYDTSNVYHSISWTNADIVQDSFFVDKRCVSGSQFSLGNTVSNELGFEIFSAGYEDWLLEGETLTVELGGYVSGVATYFEVGKFILEKPTMGTDRLIIKGYDKLTLFDTLADNWVMKTGGGENILGNAVRITSSYPMGKDGWMNLVAGTYPSPYWTASMTSCLTGLVPFSNNGRFPQKIIVSGMDITDTDSYSLLFYYNAGVLTCTNLSFYFNYLATVTQIGTNIYEVSFNAGLDPNKTAFQEYIEANFGVHDYYATFTLSNGVFQNPSSLEIKYNATAALPIEDTINDICDACGMQFFDGYPSPYNLSMSYRPLADYSKYTYRSILGLFAKACGGNLTLWPSGYGLYMGQLRIAVPTATGVTLTESEVLSCDLVNEEVVLSGTRYVDSNGALYINRTENTPPYKFLDFSDCPVFPIASQTAVDNLSALTGSANSWLPGKAKILAMPWLEPMDIVSFNYSIKPYYSGKFLVTRVHITANGATTIESAGFTESTTNSSGYTGVSYSNDANPDYDAVFSTAASQTPGTTANVALSTFPYNLPKVNDYIYADGGMGIVTAIDGSFATVNWLTNYTGSPQPHTHPLQEVYSDSGDKTAIASGDALIFTDVSDSGNLKQMVDDFDTSNTTDFLRRDGTWATPAGGGGASEIPIGDCSTAAATTAKTVTVSPAISSLASGTQIIVLFSKGHTGTAQPTLNVNGTGAKKLTYSAHALAYTETTQYRSNSVYIPAGAYLHLVYTGVSWSIVSGYETSLTPLHSTTSNRFTSADFANVPDAGLQMFHATSSMTTNKPHHDAKVLHAHWDNGSGWCSQLALGNSGDVEYRSKDASTWGNWYYLARFNKPTDGQLIVADTNNGDSMVKGVDTVVSTHIAASASQVETAATGDYILFADQTDSGKVKVIPGIIDTSKTTEYLRRDGTWAVPAGGGSSDFVIINASDYTWGTQGAGQGGLDQTLASLLTSLESQGKYAVIYDDTPSLSTEKNYYRQIETDYFEAWNDSGKLVKVDLDLVAYDYTVTTFTPAASLHSHGDISSAGALTTNPAIAADTGDSIVIADSTLGDTVKKSSITFDTTDTSNFLRKDGTWAVPAGGGGGGSTDEIPFLICSTGASTAAKTVSYTGFTLSDNKRVYVQFTNGNVANQPTLNVNGTGAKSILYAGQALRANVRDYYNGNYIPAATTVEMVYYNSYWRIVGGWTNGLPALNGSGKRLTNGNRSCSVPKLEYFLATSDMTTGKPTAGNGKVLQFNWDNNYIYASQLAVGGNDARNANRDEGWIQYRVQDGTNVDGWTDWIDVAMVREGTFTLSFNSIDETWNYIKIGRHVTIWGPSDAWVAEIVTSLSSFTGLPYAPKFGTMVHIPLDYTQSSADGYFVAKLNTDKTMNFQTLRINSGGSLILNTSMGYYLQYATPYTPITYITDD